jgi:hypothetical protein
VERSARRRRRAAEERGRGGAREEGAATARVAPPPAATRAEPRAPRARPSGRGRRGRRRRRRQHGPSFRTLPELSHRGPSPWLCRLRRSFREGLRARAEERICVEVKGLSEGIGRGRAAAARRERSAALCPRWGGRDTILRMTHTPIADAGRDSVENAKCQGGGAEVEKSRKGSGGRDAAKGAKRQRAWGKRLTDDGEQYIPTILPDNTSMRNG